MKNIVITLLLAMFVTISNVSYAEVVVSPEKMYSEALTALENNKYNEAITLFETYVGSIKGQNHKLNDVYIKLYYTNIISNNMKRAKYYESLCINNIKSFKPISNKQNKIEIHKVTPYSNSAKYNKNNLPKNIKWMTQKMVDISNSAISEMPYLVDLSSGFDVSPYLSNEKGALDTQFNTPYIEITLDNKGRKLYEDFSARTVKNQFAIIVNGEIITTPTILEKINTGKLYLSPSYSEDKNYIYKLLATINTIKRSYSKSK